MGDSFTEGSSVHSHETIGAVLRESEFNVINLGKIGNGSLIELASLKEYAEPLKPKIVLWMYYLNDLKELMNEMNSSLLIKYLNESDFSQNLISRQEEIDSLLVAFLGIIIEKERERLYRRESENVTQRIFDIIELTKLRLKIGLKPSDYPINKPIFKDILQKAKQLISGWGGKMFFVYLPSLSQYRTKTEDINREFVLNSATKLGIPIIDIHEEVFVHHPDQMSLFPFRCCGHYNADGYRLVAEAIPNRLNAEGIIPLNSKN